LIDPRAIIDPSVAIGRDVSIGPWTWIGPDVEIGDGCRIASHVVLKGPTRLGRDNRIFQFATIGEDTPALAYRGEPTRLEVGDRNTFREGVTVHRGTVQARGKTVIGDDNLFMAYVHVGHDCIVGNHVIMANNASVSGHVTVGDHANFGGYSGVPQYRSVGAYSHIAGMSLVLKDIPAYVTVAGNPAGVVGLNLEGMRRRNLPRDTVEALRKAYGIVYRQGLVVKDALAELEPLSALHAEVAAFAADVASSRWGIVRPRGEPVGE
jgi:UDP-N-acetylglucosamine acyltransferase